MHPVPVKQFCLDNDIQFAHPPPANASKHGPESKSSSALSAESDPNWLRLVDGDEQGFDVGVVVSFGYMIPEEVLEQLPLGAINLHPSLLPR